MNRERLQQMVTMLRELPATHHIGFDLETWHCGTSACAVGHACINPEFRAQGLDLYVNTKGVAIPQYANLTGWDAVEDFFDLGMGDCERLFAEWRYPNGNGTTPRQVADRIEYFLENREV